MDQTPEVSIVGCGWYGWPLAERLNASGWTVKGSKSTAAGAEALRVGGIDGYLLHLDPDPGSEVDKSLFDADVLVVNIPPRRRPDIEIYHVAQMQALGKLVRESPVSKVLFISATSVYPNVNGIVTELDDLLPDRAAGRALKRAEEYWRSNSQVRTTVLRFAGLVGGDRDPGRFLAGKCNVENGDAPVNLIHLDDCLAITLEIIEQAVWGETFNACCPEHPVRREFYPEAARKSGLAEPTFSDETTSAYKQVDSSLLMRRLKYHFIYPDPMKFP